MKNVPQVCELVEHLRFDKMRSNAAVNPSMASKTEGNFMRKGEVGDWRTHFDEGTAENWDRWIRENMEATGVRFYSGVDV